jgi:hypothetical protein
MFFQAANCTNNQEDEVGSTDRLNLQCVSRMGLGDVPFTILFARRKMVRRHANDGDVTNSLKRCLIFGFSGISCFSGMVVISGKVSSLLLILSYRGFNFLLALLALLALLELDY